MAVDPRYGYDIDAEAEDIFNFVKNAQQVLASRQAAAVAEPNVANPQITVSIDELDKLLRRMKRLARLVKHIRRVQDGLTVTDDLNT